MFVCQKEYIFVPKCLNYWHWVVLEKLLVSRCSRKFWPFIEVHCWVYKSPLLDCPPSHFIPVHNAHASPPPSPLKNQIYDILFSTLTLAIANGCLHLEFSFEIVCSLLISPIRALFPPALFSFIVLPYCLNKRQVNCDVILLERKCWWNKNFKNTSTSISHVSDSVDFWNEFTSVLVALSNNAAPSVRPSVRL